jgi:hypothetical protein
MTRSMDLNFENGNNYNCYNNNYELNNNNNNNVNFH